MVTRSLSEESSDKSSYFKEGSLLASRTLHLSLRDNPSARRNGPGGIRTLTCDHGEVLCCHYTTGPRTKAYFSCDKDSGLYPAFIEAESRFGTASGAAWSHAEIAE